MYKKPFFSMLALAASVMSLDALAFDAFIPALAAISHSVGVVEAKNSQWLISSYLFSFGLCPILYAPLSRYFGRGNALRIGLCLAFSGFILAALSSNIYILLFARALQGAGCAARVVTSSLLRDIGKGPELAKLLSLSFSIYLLFTIVSPAIGYLISAGQNWRMGFFVLSVYTIIIVLYVSLYHINASNNRKHENMSYKIMKNVFKRVCNTPRYLRYSLSMGCVTGSVFSLLISMQRIFTESYHEGSLFVPVFIGLNVILACVSAANPTVIDRWGLFRPIKYALLAHFLVIVTCMVASSLYGVVFFAACEAVVMVCFGFSYQNLSAISLSSLETEYGSGSALQGCIVLLVGTSIGTVVSQVYDGSIMVILTGQCLSATVALALISLPSRMLS